MQIAPLKTTMDVRAAAIAAALSACSLHGSSGPMDNRVSPPGRFRSAPGVLGR